MHIVPVLPTETDPAAAETVPSHRTASRRTFGRWSPSRRTFGRYGAPSRRTFGRRLPPSRRTFGRFIP